MVVAEEADGEGFVGGVGGGVGGVTKGGVPAGFDVQELKVWVGVELGLGGGRDFP